MGYYNGLYYMYLVIQHVSDKDLTKDLLRFVMVSLRNSC